MVELGVCFFFRTSAKGISHGTGIRIFIVPKQCRGHQIYSGPGIDEFLRSVKACPEISAIRNVWAAASRAIVQ